MSRTIYILTATALAFIAGCAGAPGSPESVATSSPAVSSSVTSTIAPLVNAEPLPTKTKAHRPKVSKTTKPRKPQPTKSRSAYYANCAAARAAGAAPLYRGDPGYRAGLDRDRDGKACE